MKQLTLFCLSFLATLCSFSQTRAITSSGDEVILNANGTWSYINKEADNSIKIDTNKTKFTKSVGASFLVKSTKINFGVYIDPKKWLFKKSPSGEASEFEFELKDKDAYALFITEKTEIPLETLKGIALENARSVGPDINIVKEEYRTVNNNLVLLLQMEGTIQGIKVTYRGYYFSSENGTLQLITYTATNLINEHKDDMDEFLNGFVLYEK